MNPLFDLFGQNYNQNDFHLISFSNSISSGPHFKEIQNNKSRIS
jgi:hypothetical protein